MCVGGMAMWCDSGDGLFEFLLVFCLWLVCMLMPVGNMRCWLVISMRLIIVSLCFCLVMLGSLSFLVSFLVCVW